MLNNAYDKKLQNPDTEPNNSAPAADDNDITVGKNGDTPRFVAPTHGGVDIFRLLTELEDMVENSRRIGPLRLFPEDQFHMTLMKIRANLPEEMKRASKLARESERIVEESREHAGSIVEDARKNALQEFEGSKAQAVRLRDEAQKEAVRIREEAQKEARSIVEAAGREAQQRQVEANTASEQIVAEARERAEQLVSDNDIVQQAQAVAYDIQLRAEEEAVGIKRGADEYAHDVLINLENVLGKAIYQVQCGRELLERGH